jgi:hypothetical protein
MPRLPFAQQNGAKLQNSAIVSPRWGTLLRYFESFGRRVLAPLSPGFSACSEINHVAGDSLGGFLDGLRQAGVGVDVAAYLIGGEIPQLGQGEFR